VKGVTEDAQAAEQTRVQAATTLQERGAEVAQQVHSQGLERTVLTRIGAELVAEDLDALDDPYGITARLYDIAR
jgi:hypothetical protein